jgi:D-serine deaminase-like pyridoxal phosphate-dependent protein
MAQYFASHGWKDITIAFPVNLLEIMEINKLASAINLNILVESEETAMFLSRQLTADCGFFIKIDTGYHRTGIEASNIALIDTILSAADSRKLRFKGFLAHSGQAYHAKDRSELERIQLNASKSLLLLKNRYVHLYPDMIVSVGDTPGCSQLPFYEGTDEIRPGNFVFYDVMQYALGSCRLVDIAVALVCPVVAMHPERQEAVIYGGAVHLSKEQTLLPSGPDPVFGLAVGWNGTNWDTDQVLGTVRSLSQEHGIISVTQAGSTLKPGDLLAILPVHSCLTAHLMRKYLTLNGEWIETMNS